MEPEEFEARLLEGGALEKAMRWEEAAAFYAGVIEQLEAEDGTDRTQMSQEALARLRRANASMELGLWEDARADLDRALLKAKASADRGTTAQAFLAAGVYAANRGDLARAEPFLAQSLAMFHEEGDPESIRGRGWCFLNLAALYGKTGRLDLAFVTFQKARDVFGAVADRAGVAAAWEAQAQLRRAIGDEDRWREDLAEAVILYESEGMRERATKLRALLGRKVV